MSAPFHTVFCINGPCPWFCDAARELGLPRDPDLAEEVYGQLSLAALEAVR